jgi:TonB family protein
MKAKPVLGLVTLFALSLTSCASSPAHPRSPAELAVARREWSSQARGQIRDHWNPWDVVGAAGSTESSQWRATTVLRIAVQPDGTAPRPEIVGSSGIAALDEEAVRAVAAALPLPSPPLELSSGASPVVLNLGFRVTRNEGPSAPPVDDEHAPFAVLTASCDSRATGVVDPLDVQRTIEAYRQDVAMCLGRQREVGSDEAVGEVTIEFMIVESGRVEHPIVSKSRGLTRSLEGCLVKAMSLWAFRKPNGGPAKVMFPFRFGGGQAVGSDLRREWSPAPQQPGMTRGADIPRTGL